MNNKNQFSLLFLVASMTILNACGSVTAPGDEKDTNVSAVVSEKTKVILNGKDSTLQLTAYAVNKIGERLDTPLEWHSDSPDQVDVTQEGIVTSYVTNGFARITASVGEHSGIPFNITVATVAVDTSILESEHILVVPVFNDPDAPPSSENPFKVTVSNERVVNIGDKFIVEGDRFFGGSVVDIAESNGGKVITVSPLAPKLLFSDLKVEQKTKIENLEKFVKPEVRDAYDISSDEEGRLTFTLKKENDSTQAKPQNKLLPRAAAIGSVDGSASYREWFMVCRVQGAAGDTDPFYITPPDSITFDYDLDLVFDYDSEGIGLKRLAIDGVIEGGMYFEADVVAFETATECEIDIFDIQLQVDGIFEEFYKLEVPLRVGMFAEQNAFANTGNIKASARVFGQLSMGLQCDAEGCGPLQQSSGEAWADFDNIVPDINTLTETVTVHRKVMAYFEAGLRLLGYEFFGYRIGISETTNIMTVPGDIVNENFESEYFLAIEQGFVPGKHEGLWALKPVAELLKYKEDAVFTQTLDQQILSRSPLSERVTAFRYLNEQGEQRLKLTANIVHTSERYLKIPENTSDETDIYNIQNIQFYRVTDPDNVVESISEVEPEPPVAITPGRTQFSVSVPGTFSDEPDVDFYAVVTTNRGPKSPRTLSDGTRAVLNTKFLLGKAIRLSERYEVSFSNFTHVGNFNTGKVVGRVIVTDIVDGVRVPVAGVPVSFLKDFGDTPTGTYEYLTVETDAFGEAMVEQNYVFGPGFYTSASINVYVHNDNYGEIVATYNDGPATCPPPCFASFDSIEMPNSLDRIIVSNVEGFQRRLMPVTWFREIEYKPFRRTKTNRHQV
ncbi:MAG: hypothetical protein OEZ43_17845 [Gammaproteobacteria bacterium]|nr:hypothetical protein [Gammaproteobacteria bacterium]